MVKRDEQGNIVFTGAIGKAVDMYADGFKISDIARAIGRSKSWLYQIFADPEVKEQIAKREDELIKDFRRNLKARSFVLYDKSLGVMENQLQSDNQWVKQNAARDLMNRFHEGLAGEETKEITVHVIGMPDIGQADGKEEQ